MKLPFLLLFVSMANHAVCSKWEEITFPPNVLQPDLKAIEYYFENIGHNVKAYVQWPNDITFLVQYERVKNKGYYLHIAGTFKAPSEGCRPTPLLCTAGNWRCRPTPLLWSIYNGLYYKNKKFYFLTRKDPFLKLISEDAPLQYIQPKLRKPKKFLSIQYFGEKDIKDMIVNFYSEYEYYLENYLEKSSTRFLATASRPAGHFIEYALLEDQSFLHPADHFLRSSRYYKAVASDGIVRGLIAREGNPKSMILSKSFETQKLVFDKNSKKISVAGSNGKWFMSFEEEKRARPDTKPVECVFGVRMAKTGVLAEVHESGVKMFNSHDLTFGSSYPVTHMVSVQYFRLKVRIVEPRYALHKDQLAYRYQPKNNYFQVLGHILEKKYNFLEGNDIVQDCPIVIEYAKDEGCYFWYGEELRVKQFCTDDEQLWVKTNDGKIVTLRSEFIILTSPEIKKKSVTFQVAP